MTLGEYRVGISFNPSADPAVDQVKKRIASLIDDLNGYKDKGPEVVRLVALAQTRLEDAAMWAVKAITKPPVEPLS